MSLSLFMKVHSLETFGTHEGPGIRLVIFLQGCYFRCLYCHNPDTQSLEGGKDMRVAELVALAEKQRPYFGATGGVTVSGGEPTLQVAELVTLFRALQKRGIHTALDTNGVLATPLVKKLYDMTDLILLDVKHIDETWHKTVTGMSNKNTLALAAYREKTGKPMWLRYVLVPGYTDQEEYLEQFGRHFEAYNQIERVEILPYHTLGAYKYEKLGRKNPLAGVKPPTSESIVKVQEIFGRYFARVEVR